MADNPEPAPDPLAPVGPEGGRRGRGRRRGDAEWGDAQWVDVEALRRQVGRPPAAAMPDDDAASPHTPPAGELSREEQDLEDSARGIALRHLTGAPRSRRQLEQRLADREIPEGIARRVLDRLAAVRLIDDRAFAEAWVRSRHHGKKLSKMALRRELVDKGVAEDHITAVLDPLTDADEHAAARELIVRKIAQTRIPHGASREERAERDKHVRRLVALLGRKGYGPGLAFRVVSEALDEQAGAHGSTGVG
ncbi:MAG: regulatory protein RecX [Micrococcus sp.]|nr:regulatory protein RecX [Micrococcus sp.]